MLPEGVALLRSAVPVISGYMIIIAIVIGGYIPTYGGFIAMVTHMCFV
jgi:hypothetical protein